MRKYSKKVYVCEFLKGFNLCFVEKRVHFLLHIYLDYNSRLVSVLICKFIIRHNNFE